MHIDTNEKRLNRPIWKLCQYPGVISLNVWQFPFKHRGALLSLIICPRYHSSPNHSWQLFLRGKPEVHMALSRPAPSVFDALVPYVLAAALVLLRLVATQLIVVLCIL